MDDKKLFIPLLLGTPRKNRESEDVAKWVFAKMQNRGEIESQYCDVCDFRLPHDNYGQEIKSQFPEWRDAIIRANEPARSLALYEGLVRNRLHDIALKRWVKQGVISKAWLGAGEEATTVGPTHALDRSVK